MRTDLCKPLGIRQRELWSSLTSQVDHRRCAWNRQAQATTKGPFGTSTGMLFDKTLENLGKRGPCPHLVGSRLPSSIWHLRTYFGLHVITSLLQNLVLDSDASAPWNDLDGHTNKLWDKIKRLCGEWPVMASGQGHWVVHRSRQVVPIWGGLNALHAAH